MPKSIHAAVGLSGLVILVTTLTFATPGHVAAQLSSTPTIPTVPVKVTNTPLPVVPQGVTSVTGSVNVAGSVAVTDLPPVKVGALPPVAIDPLGNTVQIGNSASNPVLVRNVDGAGDDVVAMSASALFEIGSVSARATFLTVPQGKRLVIEHYAH